MDADQTLEFEPGTAKFADWANRQNRLKFNIDVPKELLPPPLEEKPHASEAREKQLRNPTPSNWGVRRIVFEESVEARRNSAEATEPFSARCGVDYQLKNPEGESHGGDPDRVSLSPLYLGKHSDGWVVSGLVHDEDWFYAVGAFEARHPELGIVHGDFEREVHASTITAFLRFIESYPPIVWDASDQ